MYTSLDRRLSCFNIHRNGKGVSVEMLNQLFKGTDGTRPVIWLPSYAFKNWDGLKMRQPGNKKPKEKDFFLSLLDQNE